MPSIPPNDISADLAICDEIIKEQGHVEREIIDAAHLAEKSATNPATARDAIIFRQVSCPKVLQFKWTLRAVGAIANRHQWDFSGIATLLAEIDKHFPRGGDRPSFMIRTVGRDYDSWSVIWEAGMNNVRQIREYLLIVQLTPLLSFPHTEASPTPTAKDATAAVIPVIAEWEIIDGSWFRWRRSQPIEVGKTSAKILRSVLSSRRQSISISRMITEVYGNKDIGPGALATAVSRLNKEIVKLDGAPQIRLPNGYAHLDVATAKLTN